MNNQINIKIIFCSVKKLPEPKKTKDFNALRINTSLLNNETFKNIIGVGLNNTDNMTDNIQLMSNKKDYSVFLVVGMHPGLMEPTETLGKFMNFTHKFH